MVEISDSVHSVVRSRLQSVSGRGGVEKYHLEIPTSEVELGDLEEGKEYRVVVIEEESEQGVNTVEEQRNGHPQQTVATPPVEEGERRSVEIESVGDQGDGIAKVERGFVVIVPGGQPGDEVEVEIDTVNDNVAFAEMVDEPTVR